MYFILLLGGGLRGETLNIFWKLKPSTNKRRRRKERKKWSVS
jgi:hypothetical protein